MPIKTYKCELSSNEVNIEIIKDTGIFSHCIIDEKNIKLFILLLTNCINDLKQNNIANIRQIVNLEDWNLYLSKNKNWNLITYDILTQTVIIECDINNALQNILNGLGFNELN